ncbi:hypothetical protein [Caviibacter abscessus]|uniref:hypothetical protein n=1 Tax=Caviibacter abscessus TaxID=1766719 RepID=UPI0008382780|nr:hypothetical protein [Caviibacter abscessus]
MISINIDEIMYIETNFYLKTKKLEKITITYNNWRRDIFMYMMNDSMNEHKVLEKALKKIWNLTKN